MITRIEVDGFKSLRGFAVDLEPLTAIVGANGTGKSNLFDALRLFSHLPDMDVVEALGGGRGSRRDQFSRMADEVGRSMTLAVELLLPALVGRKPLDQTRFRYEIAIERSATTSGVETVQLHHEHLTAITRESDAWIERHPKLSPLARYGREVFQAKLDPDLSPFSASQRTLRWSPPVGSSLTMGTLGKQRSVLSFPPGMGPEFLEEIRDELRGFSLVHLEPSKLRQTSERVAPTALSSDGGNLPAALEALPLPLRAEIRADLAAMVPTFRSFDVVPVGDEFALEVEFTDGQRLPGRLLSDGTLRLFALFTMLRASRLGTVIAVEEPENGIHPGYLRTLMRMLIEATSRSGNLAPQVIVNSHSPTVVAALHDQRESLVVADLVRRGDGLLSTRMRHIWRDGAPRDRGATTASMHEIERYLDAARPYLISGSHAPRSR